jgi:predicted MFS family arabinose efflux permease
MSDSTSPEPAVAERPGPPRVLWRQPDFIKVLTGETISDVGSQVGDLALPLAAALVLTATPAQMATLRAAEYLPRILIGLIAGVWIDRLRRRPVLMATNLARALVLLLVAATAALGLLQIELLYAAGIVLAGLGVVFGTALQAYLPSLVPRPSLVAANAARATSSAVTDVVGPGLGGILVQVLGTPGAIALDGVSFVASALGITLVRTPEPPPPARAERRQMHVELMEGVRTLLGNPILRGFTATAFTAQFFYSVIMAIYILYLSRDLALSPATIGLIFGFGGGAGVLVGSAVAARVARWLGLGRTLVGAHGLFGMFGVFLALAVVWPAQAAALVVVAEFTQLCVNAIYMVNRASVEQAVTPQRLRGRVQASRTVAHALSGTLGILAGGAIAEGVGTSAAIVVGVAGGLLSFAWVWRSPIRQLEGLPEPLE